MKWETHEFDCPVQRLRGPAKLHYAGRRQKEAGMKSTTSSKTTSPDARSANCFCPLATLREPPVHPPPGPSRSGKRILLVNDHPTMRDLLSDALRDEGYFVILADNQQQAGDLASKSSFNLVLVDLNGPFQNVWETFDQLTREYPLTPIIIATGGPNQLFTALNTGVGVLLRNSIDIPMLLRAIKQLLSRSAEQQLLRLAGRTVELFYKPATAHNGMFTQL